MHSARYFSGGEIGSLTGKGIFSQTFDKKLQIRRLAVTHRDRIALGNQEQAQGFVLVVGFQGKLSGFFDRYRVVGHPAVLGGMPGCQHDPVTGLQSLDMACNGVFTYLRAGKEKTPTREKQWRTILRNVSSGRYLFKVILCFYSVCGVAKTSSNLANNPAGRPRKTIFPSGSMSMAVGKEYRAKSETTSGLPSNVRDTYA